MTDYRFPQALLQDLNKNIFISMDEELMPYGCDGVYMRPSVSFVRVDFDRLDEEGELYDAAVREYMRIRDSINADKKIRSEHGFNFSVPGIDRETARKMDAWKEKTAYFVLPEDHRAAFKEWNTLLFSSFCEENGVHYVVQEGKVFYDLTTKKDFIIECEHVPGSADDAATYLYYKIREVEPWDILW